MRVCFVLTIVLFSSVYVQAQTIKKPAPAQISLSSAAKSSPAYSEVLLRKTERESELEEFLLTYKEEFPKVMEIRFELGLLQKEADKIIAVNASEAGKLTLALGKLMVRKIEIETDLWNLRQQYNNDHPEVKRTRRKIEIFEKSIKEILQ